MFTTRDICRAAHLCSAVWAPKQQTTVPHRTDTLVFVTVMAIELYHHVPLYYNNAAVWETNRRAGTLWVAVS